MPRTEKKYHVIYKTTNTLTGRYYIGMHSTDNLDDGYLGSGRRLKYSVKKYGQDKHTVEILEQCSDRPSLIEKEKEIVNHDLIKDDDCMNLHTGGMCGPISNLGSKRSEETKAKMRAWVRTPEMGRKISKKLTGRSLSDEHKQKLKESHTGLTHSEETKQKMSNWDRSEDMRKKISETLKDKPKTNEHKENMKKPPVTCPYCNKIGRGNIMKRFHFDNCKYKL